jgi:hypothetical protein
MPLPVNAFIYPASGKKEIRESLDIGLQIT